jgi:hypothetical protein
VVGQIKNTGADRLERQKEGDKGTLWTSPLNEYYKPINAELDNISKRLWYPDSDKRVQFSDACMDKAINIMVRYYNVFLCLII